MTNSSGSSYVKNQFWGPSREVIKKNLWAPLFLFFLLFFLIFCSFLHFVDFSFSFFIFSEEKSFFFSFSCFSFKFVLLLASVSEFNCFLRSRSSMEMWCPDDARRDIWDWVGPPAWVRACFNLPRVGWRLLACQNGASPDCIILVCFGKVLTDRMCISTNR